MDHLENQYSKGMQSWEWILLPSILCYSLRRKWKTKEPRNWISGWLWDFFKRYRKVTAKTVKVHEITIVVFWHWICTLFFSVKIMFKNSTDAHFLMGLPLFWGSSTGLITTPFPWSLQQIGCSGMHVCHLLLWIWTPNGVVLILDHLTAFVRGRA